MSLKRLFTHCVMVWVVLSVSGCALLHPKLGSSRVSDERAVTNPEIAYDENGWFSFKEEKEEVSPSTERPEDFAVGGAPPAEEEEGAVVVASDGHHRSSETDTVRPTPPVETADRELVEVEIQELKTLKAGQANDNLRFDAFRSFIDTYEPDHSTLVHQRNHLTVQREDGSPVHGAVIALNTKAPGREVVLRTGSDGRAYLYPGLWDVVVPIQAQVSCPQLPLIHEAHQPKTVTIDDEETVVTMTCVRPQDVLLDIVFLHDVTGSMSDEMAQLRLTTERVMAKLGDAYGQSPTMIRVGGVLYRDRGDDFVTRRIDFSTPDGFVDQFAHYGANGGGDAPESVNAGLNEVLGMVWREHAIKVVILIGDAAPHDYWDDPWDRYLDLTQDAIQQGIRIHTISASGMTDRGEVAWREMAAFSGGKYVFLTYEDAAESSPGGETTRHVDGGYNVSDLGSIIFSLLKQEIEAQLRLR